MAKKKVVEETVAATVESKAEVADSAVENASGNIVSEETAPEGTNTESQVTQEDENQTVNPEVLDGNMEDDVNAEAEQEDAETEGMEQ